jgi:hypothetical protein
MAKIIERPIRPGKGSLSKEKTVLRDSKTGQFVTIHTVRTNSATFTSDLGKAFRSNVDAALKKKK